MDSREAAAATAAAPLSETAKMETKVKGEETQVVQVEDAAYSLCALGQESAGPVPDARDDAAITNSTEPEGSAGEAMNIDVSDAKSSSKQKDAPKKATGRSSSVAAKPRRDPKRDTSVPFDEMKRLMRVYGPLKCLRNRTPIDSGRTAKPDSIKRKFYRWFPDLDERFVRTPEGWFKPIAGHEEEMQRREELRKIDQEDLVRKRNEKRQSSSKQRDAAQAI